MPDSRRCYGTLVSSRMVKGVFWDCVDVSPGRLVLRPWLRTTIVLERAAVRQVEIEVMHVPFHWATAFFFRLDDGRRAPKLFTPWSTRTFRRLLTDAGWPTVDLPKVTLRSWRPRAR